VACAVRAVTDDRVVGIHDGEHASQERDFGSLQAVGVATAIDALVVPADDGEHGSKRRRSGESLFADGGMLPEQSPLVVILARSTTRPVPRAVERVESRPVTREEALRSRG
jgi:hypothetical protein